MSSASGCPTPSTTGGATRQPLPRPSRLKKANLRLRVHRCLCQQCTKKTPRESNSRKRCGSQLGAGCVKCSFWNAPSARLCSERRAQLTSMQSDALADDLGRLGHLVDAVAEKGMAAQAHLLAAPTPQRPLLVLSDDGIRFADCWRKRGSAVQRPRRKNASPNYGWTQNTDAKRASTV
jgi:hypothetical protein